MKRIATALSVLAAVLSVGLVAAPAHADKPECYTVDALPGECLTLVTSTYIANLQGYRDHLIAQLLATRAERQDAELEAVALRQDLFEAVSKIAERNRRISILKDKLASRKAEIRRLRAVIDRLR